MQNTTVASGVASGLKNSTKIPFILADASLKIQALQPKLSIPPYSEKGVPQKPFTESLAAMLGGEA
jgi:hypothetical protein